MDREGFDIIDQNYQKELAALRAKTRAELDEEIRKGRGFKFGEHEAEWKLARYPYSSQGRTKAQKSHDKSEAAKEAKLQAEVDSRMMEKQTILERLHFGERGREHAYNQVYGEQKTPPVPLKAKVVERYGAGEAQAKENQRSANQDIKAPDVRGEFQEQNAQTKQRMETEAKISAFKNRLNAPKIIENQSITPKSEPYAPVNQVDKPKDKGHGNNFSEKSDACKEDFKQRLKEEMNSHSAGRSNERARE